MWSRIGRVDARVDAYFDELRGNPAADRVFYSASALGDFGLIWVMLALARALRGRPGDDRAAVRAIVAAGIESVLVNGLVKSLIRRRRPVEQIDHPHPFRQPVTSSFPSGHATAAFCAATLLSEEDALAPLYYTGATVVALSRIHTKIHHASDVAAGVVVGVALGRLGRRLVPLHPRRAPARLDNDKETDRS